MGSETLVLLHGLGANREVWRRALALRPDAVTPDLPGHGAAPRLASYSFGSYADALLPCLPAGGLRLVGHSMGGMVALEIASRRPDDVLAVVAVGVKVHWPPEDVAAAARQASRPSARFAIREEAAEHFLRIAGLTGLLGADDPAVTAGVVPVEGGWRLAQDPGTFGFGTPDIRTLLGKAPALVTLARGEHDEMVTEAQLGKLVADPVTLPGLGHNCHVEDPAAVLGLLR